MHELLNWIWQGSAVAFATLVVLRLLARAHARDRYLVCAGALAAVLTMPLLALAPAGQPFLDSSFSAAPAAALTLPARWWTSAALAGGAWALWTGIHGLLLAGALRSVRTARRASRPFPPRRESRLPHWLDVSREGRRARLVLSDDIDAAAVLGGRVPVIAVAPALLERLTDEELDRVIVHEWAHVQRRDDLLNVVHLLVRAAAGWHPAVWWLERQMRAEREAACDEAVVAATGCPRTYASSLAAVAALAAGRRARLPVPGIRHASGVRSRVVRVLGHSRRVPQPWSVTGAAAGALLLAGVAYVVAGLPAFGAAAPAPRNADARARPVGSPDPAVTEAGGALMVPRAEAEAPASASASAPASRTTQHEATRDFVPTSRAAETALDAFPPPAAAPRADMTAPGRRLPVDPTASAPMLSALQRPPAAAPVASPEPRITWGAAADAGAAMARGSQRAAGATAGAFSRFGRRIATSF